VLAGLLMLARAPKELAEAEVAVGDEGPHAEFGGERQRLLEMDLGTVCVRRITGGLGLAESPETLRFITPLAAGASTVKTMLGDGASVTWTPGQKQRLALPVEAADPDGSLTGFGLDRCLF
jgi:hypothetical protein